ncbi:MAG TPA: cyclic nucleotide-binding domain-containing protein [Desulfobacteria bacterium]|nr:cyclic nucleotide-binding domain-containing protein [Desulfobacteria bacterium]
MANNLAPPIVNLSYKKGDLIIKEGDYGVSIYKILEGKAVVLQESESREIPITTLGIGDIFGERTFLNRASETRSASVRAVENTTVEVWHTKRLSKEYENMPPIIKYITDQILTRSIRMNNLIVKLINQEKKEAARVQKEDPLVSQRRFYRKDVDMVCRYRPVGMSGKFQLKARIKDISLGGLGMVANRVNSADVSHAEGDRFLVTAVLPNQQPLELEGEVISVEDGENTGEMLLGMNISEISHNAKKSLGFFLMP